MPHVKKDVIKISSRNSIAQRCGDCLHFEMNAKFEKPCSQLGIKKYAAAPPCFSPNVYALTNKSPEVLYQIGLLFHNFTPTETRVALSLLNTHKTFQKAYGVGFGQPVYFKLGADYLSNYFKGYVAGVASAGDQQVFVTSSLNGSQNLKPVIASLTRDSVFSVTAFQKKKAELVAQGRLQDPSPLKTPPKKAVTVNYEPPSMERAPEKWFESFGSRMSSKRRLKRGKDQSVTFKIKT